MAYASSASARPTDTSEMFSFSITDQITHWETPDGAIRVHYSVDGPNQVRSGDTNDDGVPDFVEEVVEIAQESLSLFNGLNLLPPMSETEFTLADNGGSNALDFYLVDFGGNSDGSFGIDACDNQNQCTGHMVIENDFSGYSYSSYREGLETVVPHELFHFVQAAYNAQLPIWISEGTAVWGQRRFDPESRDFRGFANQYLDDTGRPLNKPPSGPVPSFAYGTAIWWEFLTLRHDNLLVADLLTSWQGLTEDAEFVAAMVEHLESSVDTMEAAWMDFSSYNLGTGGRAGSLESYPDAQRFAGIQPAEEGSNATIETSNRFYPITTNYYLVEHTGGPLYWSMAKESPNLRLEYFPATSAFGEVQVSLDQWASDVAQPYALNGGESLPAGSYWLVVMNPTTTGNSVYTDICLGTEAIAQSCLPEADPEEQPEAGEGETTETESSGCQQASHPPLWLLLFGLFCWNRTSRNSRKFQTH